MTKDKDYYLGLYKNNIDSKYEKNTPGFIIHDLGVTVSKMAENIKKEIDTTVSKIDVNNLFNDELERFVNQRGGLSRRNATKSQVILTITGNGDISKGDLFSTTNDILFESLETKHITDTGTINAQAMDPGSMGNVGSKTITEIPVTIQGISKVINDNSSYDGFAAETDTELRKRYLDYLKLPITSNNMNHYKKWALEVSGVGNAKILPTWKGNNSVKVLILDSKEAPANVSLIKRVQDYIDPLDPMKWGKGHGKASLGAFCTVDTPKIFYITILMKIKIEKSLLIDNIKQKIREKIIEYLHSISFTDITEVSFAGIVKNIMSVEGVIDAKDISINGTANSLVIPANEVPGLKQIDVNPYV